MPVGEQLGFELSSFCFLSAPFLHLNLSHPSLSSCFLSPENDCGLAVGRSRREKKEKTGRKSALEQLKRAKKGEKVKYEVRVVCVLSKS